MESLEFKLVRQAKSSGGDRYEHGVKGDEDHMVVYVPQTISRAAGAPFPVLKISIKAG